MNVFIISFNFMTIYKFDNCEIKLIKKIGYFKSIKLSEKEEMDGEGKSDGDRKLLPPPIGHPKIKAFVSSARR